MKILLIEDDLDDIELLQDALSSNGVAYEMQIVNDGSSAVSHLRQTKACPDIIIMDFNLPKVHGREVLIEIRANKPFKKVPVLILTTSSASEDVKFSYNHGANRFMVKPTTMANIRETVNTIVELGAPAMY